MNNREVAHLWNAQARASAKGSNFYFEGPTIYSYGPHFPIARIHSKRNDSLVLFNAARRSNSTSKHQSYTRQACSNRHVVTVPHVDPRYRNEHGANLDYLAAQQAGALKAAQRRVTTSAVQWDRNAADSARTAYSVYCAFFGIRRKALPTLEAEFNAAAARAQRIENPDPASADKRERAKAARKAAKEVKERKARELAAVHDMAYRTDRRLHGAFTSHGHFNRSLASGPVMLRVTEFADAPACIETSMGARVPLAAAPMVWRMVERARSFGAFERSGFKAGFTDSTGSVRHYTRDVGVRIGDYPLDRIDADGTLHAGCHVIPYSELSAMARTLGLEEKQ
jgi:hypothetical protein